MTKQKSTKRALLLSALSLLMCVSMLVGTTFAWFTDSVISGNNKIVAGNLDIDLEYYNGTEWKTVNGASNLFDETLWEPGHTDVVYLRLKNIGSLALKYELAINIVSETPGINMAGEEFLLSDYIRMGVAEGQKPSFASRSAAQAAVSATAGLISEGYVADGEMAKDAEDLYMAVVVYMPSSVDNDANYRGDTAPSIDLGINLVATQLMKEEDSFGKDYDEAAKYVISSDEKMIFNGTEFDTLVSNNGAVDMTNVKIENDNTGFENYGDATLTDVTVNAGTPGTNTFGYAINAYAGSTTVLNDVTVKSANGAIGVTDGANLTFNSGSVEVDSKNTSGRYLFYVVGNGSTLTINGGNFDFNKTQNQKRAYIYAGDDTTVYVKGGTFGKASTRSGYTAGILGTGDVIITGGTFGFDPTTWVASGYKAEKVGTNWIVIPASAVIAADDAALDAAISAGESAIYLMDGDYTADLYSVAPRDSLTIVGNGAGTKLAFNNLQVRASQFKNLTISNCTVERMPDKSWGHLVFGSSTQAGGVYTISNCTFNGVGSQGIYINQNVEATFNIENCTFNGDFGGEGAITVQNNDNVNITVNVTGCAFNNIPETSHEIYILYKYAGWTLNADGVNAFWK